MSQLCGSLTFSLCCETFFETILSCWRSIPLEEKVKAVMTRLRGQKPRRMISGSRGFVDLFLSGLQSSVVASALEWLGGSQGHPRLAASLSLECVSLPIHTGEWCERAWWPGCPEQWERGLLSLNIDSISAFSSFPLSFGTSEGTFWLKGKYSPKVHSFWGILSVSVPAVLELI